MVIRRAASAFGLIPLDMVSRFTVGSPYRSQSSAYRAWLEMIVGALVGEARESSEPICERYHASAFRRSFGVICRFVSAGTRCVKHIK